ncbi:LCP family protein [Microlunatus soli]|uniref:Cell envelope-related function transcriptional attenuator common domain-containing protein n=1 Tax=Microlunatus soli TaxID=630515 RepID=A0A1H1XF17_9ACTN|nr:LCP family protein [Microlunatus soli]SDT07883.1 cell envelope-related function transcriptional attenuator common domain-containing protein [Microlunatus soli]
MAPGHDDDLDWLYQRDKKPGSEPEPEPTRVLPASDVPPAGGRPDRPQQPPRQSWADQQGAPDQRRRSDQPDWGDQQGGSGQPPQSPPAAARPVKPRPPKRPGRKVLAVVGILVLALIVWLIAVPIYAWSHVDRVAYEPSGDRPDDQPGTTYLLVGSDSRSGLTKAEKKKLGTGSSAGGRTDTMMILYVPPGGEPALISLPRDSFLEIPGHGSNKLNAAYSFGGPKLLTKTVEQNTGLRIDEYVEVGFAGFVNVIDAIGGVEVCLKKPIKDKDSHINLKAGCQNLEGKNALGYVRMRKADAEGDLGRVKRQRQMVSAMASKAASPASVLNPVRYWKLANAGTDSLAVGENTSMFAMLRMGLAMGKVSSSGGLTLTVPISNPDASTSAGSSVLWDDKEAKDMFGQIARGDTSGLKQYLK